MRMEVESCEEEITWLKISVEDTGKGISEEDQQKLFTAFQRVDEAKNRNIEGTGLGLHITQELVHLMNGRVEVKSSYGKGSTFTVWIPQKIVDKEPMGKVDLADNKSTGGSVYKPKLIAEGAKILVVDDAPMNVAVFKGLLKNSKIEVDTATSGKACLALTEQKKYHMIFLDHMMPEMDGVETLYKLKKEEKNLNREIPIIMLTANAISGAKEEYLEMGFTDYLSKPMDSKHLEEMIAKYLPKGMCNM